MKKEVLLKSTGPDVANLELVAILDLLTLSGYRGHAAHYCPGCSALFALDWNRHVASETLDKHFYIGFLVHVNPQLPTVHLTAIVRLLLRRSILVGCVAILARCRITAGSRRVLAIGIAVPFGFGSAVRGITFV